MYSIDFSYKEDTFMSVSATFAVQAQEFLEQGHPAEAIALCRQGLTEYPDYVTAYLVLARAFIAVGDYASAEQALERGARQSPRSTSARALRKEVQYALKLKEQKEKHTTAHVNGGASVPTGLQSALQEASEAVTYIDNNKEIPTEQAERTLGTYLRIIETDKSANEQQSSFRSNNLRLIPGLEFTPLRVESPSLTQQAEQRRTGSVPEPPPLTEFADWQQYQESLRNDQAVPMPLEQSTAEIISAEMLKPQTGYSRPPMPTPRFSIREIENLPTTGATEETLSSDIDNLAERMMNVQMPEARELMNREADIPEYLQQNSGETVSDAQPNAGTVIISETMARIYEAQGALSQALHAYRTLAAEAEAQHNEEKFNFFVEKIQAMQSRIASQPLGI
jgi:tetratricopeptide (TPR) repeat protein